MFARFFGELIATLILVGVLLAIVFIVVTIGDAVIGTDPQYANTFFGGGK